MKLQAASEGGFPAKAVGLAAVGVFAVALVGVVIASGALDRSATALGRTTAGVLAAAGFKVRQVHVQGAAPIAEADILRASGLYRDEPIFGMDLDALRARIEKVGWVKSARVVRLLPNSFAIVVDERPASAVWQEKGRLYVIDDRGLPIREANPASFPQLPLVVGQGAAETANEILPLIRSRPRLMQRLEALVRVDERRWDLRMKDGGLIQLPAVDADAALIRLDTFDRKWRVLDLGFARIDLRDTDSIAVRPKVAVLPPPPATGAANGAVAATPLQSTNTATPAPASPAPPVEDQPE